MVPSKETDRISEFVAVTFPSAFNRESLQVDISFLTSPASQSRRELVAVYLVARRSKETIYIFDGITSIRSL